MRTSTPEIDIDQFAATRDSAVVVDVRERGEYAAGHVPGALMIPMGQLSSRMGELPPQNPVYVICATGNRSRAMTDLLRARGFDAASVAGGIRAWSRTGRPVEGGLR